MNFLTLAAPPEGHELESVRTSIGPTQPEPFLQPPGPAPPPTTAAPAGNRHRLRSYRPVPQTARRSQPEENDYVGATDDVMNTDQEMANLHRNEAELKFPIMETNKGDFGECVPSGRPASSKSTHNTSLGFELHGESGEPLLSSARARAHTHVPGHLYPKSDRDQTPVKQYYRRGQH